MRIGVIGARLAGSYVSLLLSRAGHEVLLLDDSLERDKPCGGGVTGKALSGISWLQQLRLPHTEIRAMRMFNRDGASAQLTLRNPIHIFCRTTLDTALRESAFAAGTRLIPERAVAFSEQRDGWIIQTPKSSHQVHFLIGADGATSTVRAATIGKYSSRDLSLALGFYLPGIHHTDTIVAEFQERGFHGYIWSFPRIDHASVGILRWLPHTNAAELRRRVLDFISARYPETGKCGRFYAARIPCLSRHKLLRQKSCGNTWALLGDAAGFADAITAEGIFYALRSAELLAETLLQGNIRIYERRWRRDFGADLFRAAAWRDRFYCGTFLFQAFTHRALQSLGRSPTICELTDRVIAGRATYERLRQQLIWRSPQILVEALASKMFG